MMPQVSNLPCGKIVLCQSGDWVTETLSPGQSWSTLGFTKSIITSDWLKSYVAPIMKGVSYDVVEPVISDRFSVSKYPSKPIIAVHSREQRDGVNLIKKFYLKFPQFRWVTFRDMRSQTEEEFSNTLKESCVSVWMDTQSSFGTFPLESMASNWKEAYEYSNKKTIKINVRTLDSILDELKITLLFPSKDTKSI
jgi:hypothetical protein